MTIQEYVKLLERAFPGERVTAHEPGPSYWDITIEIGDKSFQVSRQFCTNNKDDIRDDELPALRDWYLEEIERQQELGEEE